METLYTVPHRGFRLFRHDRPDHRDHGMYVKESQYWDWEKKQYSYNEVVSIDERPVFSDVLTPIGHRISRASGQVEFTMMFDDSTVIMTQRNLYGLLKALIDGRVQATKDGFDGHYTFDRTGGILTVKVID